mgnify:CR=1 FL=1
MDYVTIRGIHIACVALSWGLFTLRGIWMLTDSPRRLDRWARTVPHINDTVLLAAGITLAVLSRQYPGMHDWLNAKLIGLITYILLGIVALRAGRTKRIRIAAFVMAQWTILYIVAVAMTRSATPWIGLLASRL